MDNHSTPEGLNWSVWRDKQQAYQLDSNLRVDCLRRPTPKPMPTPLPVPVPTPQHWPTSKSMPTPTPWVQDSDSDTMQHVLAIGLPILLGVFLIAFWGNSRNGHQDSAEAQNEEKEDRHTPLLREEEAKGLRAQDYNHHIDISTVERYECIGSGRNGQVFRARWNQNIVAMKIFDLTPKSLVGQPDKYDPPRPPRTPYTSRARAQDCVPHIASK